MKIANQKKKILSYKKKLNKKQQLRPLFQCLTSLMFDMHGKLPGGVTGSGKSRWREWNVNKDIEVLVLIRWAVVFIQEFNTRLLKVMKLFPHNNYLQNIFCR